MPHKFLILLIALGVIAGFRYVESDRAMDDQLVASLISTQQSYISTIVVMDEPQSKNYITSAVAFDHELDHKVFAKSTSSTQQRLHSSHVGDTFLVQGYLQELSDFQKYKMREHIVGVFVVEDIISQQTTPSWFTSSINALRDSVSRHCSHLKYRGLCEGLLIGERNNIPDDTYSTFRQAQLTHLIVASGANIALLLSFVRPFLKHCPLIIRHLMIITLALGYCVLTRFEPSMIRASAMVIIPSLYALRGFRISSTKVFVVTIAVCIAFDPFLLFRVGFWLSACATAGLIFLSPAIVQKVRFSILADTLAASLMVMPVIWVVFGFQPPWKWWISVIAIALAGPLTMYGMSVMAVASLLGKSVITDVMYSWLDQGLAILSGVGELGARPISSWIGLCVSVIAGLAYTGKIVIKSGSRRERQPSYLYRGR